MVDPIEQLSPSEKPQRWALTRSGEPGALCWYSISGIGIVTPMVADDASLRVERGPGTIVLIGEIDAYTEARVLDALTCAPNSGDLWVDLSGVTFIDSSGLRVMIATHQRLEREGCRLVLVAPSTPVTRLIEIAGLASHLHVEPRSDPADSTQRDAGATGR